MRRSCLVPKEMLAQILNKQQTSFVNSFLALNSREIRPIMQLHPTNLCKRSPTATLQTTLGKGKHAGKQAGVIEVLPEDENSGSKGRVISVKSHY